MLRKCLLNGLKLGVCIFYTQTLKLLLYGSNYHIHDILPSLAYETHPMHFTFWSLSTSWNSFLTKLLWCLNLLGVLLTHSGKIAFLRVLIWALFSPYSSPETISSNQRLYWQLQVFISSLHLSSEFHSPSDYGHLSLHEWPQLNMSNPSTQNSKSQYCAAYTHLPFRQGSRLPFLMSLICVLSDC